MKHFKGGTQTMKVLKPLLYKYAAETIVKFPRTRFLNSRVVVTKTSATGVL
jgi:predicted ATP-grasp superfamily ATP-dependent carboligase